MSKRDNTHPLEDYVQGLDHSQFAAMYSRSEVKPSLSTAVSCQEIDFVRPSAHSTTLPVDHLMARRGFNAHLVKDCIQGLDHSQLAEMYSRGEVKPSLSTRCVLANRVPSDSDSLYIAQRCLCVAPCIREVT